MNYLNVAWAFYGSCIELQNDFGPKMYKTKIVWL